MRRRGAVLAMVWIMAVAGCSRTSAPDPQASSREPVAASAAGIVKSAPAMAGGAMQASPTFEGAESQRRIVRSAELGLEAADPADAARAAGVVVAQLGGYVASSDRSLRADEEERMTTVVNMVLRVPSDRFMEALARLEKLGSRTIEQQVRSDDVTEEVIDLTARIGAQRALEVQFLEILKQAKAVKDALEVNVQLAEVRTTIEKLEGRQRLLENQMAISTIKLAVAPSAPLVRADRFAFGDSLARAHADLVNVSATILHGAIRVFGVLVPILALVVAPFAILVRALLRRARRAPAT